MAIGINGMGRIGRLALRAALGGLVRPPDDPRADNRLHIIHVNELKGGTASTAHLLEFDSVHGRWRASIERDGEAAIAVAGRRIGFTSASTPAEIAWGDLGCDVVLECTGKFLKPEQLEGYFRRGVRRVIVAAPVKDPAALNIVVGVNDNLYDPPSPQAADGRFLHHQLSRPGRKGRARSDWHPPRSVHDHSRPTPTSLSTRAIRTCAALVRRCSRCNRPRPAAP